MFGVRIRRPAKITIAFHGQSIATTANNLGLWEAWLAPEPAGGPFTLTVHGSSELTRSDLLLGDVWFASGQSNMEMPLSGFPPNAHVTNAEQEIAQADLPQVRLLRMEHQSSASPLASISAVWQTCTPATARDFSAVAYFFARADSRARACPHRSHRFFLGRHTDRFLDQSRRPLGRRLAHARLRRACRFRRQADAPELIEAAEKVPMPRRPPIICPQPLAPVASGPVFLDPGRPVQRNGRALHPLPHQRLPLVPGGD